MDPTSGEHSSPKSRILPIREDHRRRARSGWRGCHPCGLRGIGDSRSVLICESARFNALNSTTGTTPAAPASSDEFFKPTRRVREAPGGKQHINLFDGEFADDALSTAPSAASLANETTVSLYLTLSRNLNQVQHHISLQPHPSPTE